MNELEREQLQTAECVVPGEYLTVQIPLLQIFTPQSTVLQHVPHFLSIHGFGA